MSRKKKNKKKKKLEKKQTLFIIVGSVLLVVFGLGVYVNHQLDTLLNAWNSVGAPIAVKSEPDPQNPEDVNPGDPGSSEGHSWSFEVQSPQNSNEDELPSYQEMARQVEARVGRPVEKTDMMRVGLILVRRLDRSEINYLPGRQKRHLQRRRRLIRRGAF